MIGDHRTQRFNVACIRQAYAVSLGRLEALKARPIQLGCTAPAAQLAACKKKRHRDCIIGLKQAQIRHGQAANSIAVRASSAVAQKQMPFLSVLSWQVRSSTRQWCLRSLSTIRAVSKLAIMQRFYDDNLKR